MSDLSSRVEAHAAQMKQDAGNIATYALPELPESSAAEVYERVIEYEAQLTGGGSPKNDYDSGSATVDDELFVRYGESPSLVTAEHATNHPRNGVKIDADLGTAGLGRILHEDVGSSFIAAIGRQTGDANYDREHPMKNVIREVMISEGPMVITALHGFPRGKFGSLDDTRPIDAVLGIGDSPSQSSVYLAELGRAVGKELGLRVEINHPHVRLKDGKPILDSGGNLRFMTLKAAGPNTTRSFEQRTAKELDYKPGLVQLEFSSLLRAVVDEGELDPKSRVMGVYLGYLLAKSILEAGHQLEA